MKQYYESEILFQLMEREGFNIPSSVPPYESEIKAYLINQVKQAYPKLTDYEAEWLFYNHTKHLPAEFPIHSLINVTEATVDNVVPYAYKSAVLKGQTLVNIINSNNPKHNFIDYNLLIDDNTKTYYVKFEASVQVSVIGLIVDDSKWNVNKSHVDSTNGYVILTPDKNQAISALRVRFDDNKDTAYIPSVNLVCIEYQEGMENWDIPFFEGMTSVETPVLTSSNEDGTKSNILMVNEDVELRGIGDSSNRVEDELDCLTGELTQRIGEIVLDGSHPELSLNTSNDNTVLIIFKSIKTGLSSDGVCICDKLPFKANSSEDFEHMRLNVNGNVCLWINKSKFEELTVAGVKKYLLQNPITVQYPLVTESVKTVDLLVQNQDGKTLSVIKPIEGTMHLSTSSDTFKPLFSGEIPVEATTQNLASFIDLEMEE